MHKSKSVLENGTKKIPRDLDVQIDRPILTRRPDQVLNYKKKTKCCLVNFASPVDF